jgi:hypothetical protein
MNCSRASIDPSGFDPNASEVLGQFFEHGWFQVSLVDTRSLHADFRIERLDHWRGKFC